jgi:competence protein ComEC
MKTRFRAYQLDSEGSLFSHYKPNCFTLIEARLPKEGIDVLRIELAECGKSRVDCLHITSWDQDHCKYADLIQILNKFRPNVIEYPDYAPDTDNGKLSKKTIESYDDVHEKYTPNCRPFNKTYFDSLTTAPKLGTNNIVYRPEFKAENSNDKSLIKLFRSNGFNVVSLGDLESSTIAERLAACEMFYEEIDVLILPHHGADNGFITGDFLDKINPKMAICSSNYDNQYDHPRDTIRSLLSNREIKLMTTKRGDIIITHSDSVTSSNAWNFVKNNEDLEEKFTFYPKRYS